MNANYKTIKIKKLYQGNAEIRSYQLTEIRKARMGIKFVLNEGDIRYVPNSLLKLGKRGTTINARFPLPDGSRTYSLVAWKWDDLPMSLTGMVQQSLLSI